jgi:catechol 2,3-dioxygenase-like lactoylglutathione lyase family enzyme
MFSHVMVGGDDIAVAKKFYDAALGALGIPEGKIDPKGRVFYRTPTGAFGVSKPIDGKAACGANGGTIGFLCDTPEKAKALHDAGVARRRTARSTSPMCAIRRATRSARCTARSRGGPAGGRGSGRCRERSGKRATVAYQRRARDRMG